MKQQKVLIGSRIQTLRKAKALSQKELASKIKTNPFYLSKIERNERLPSLTFCYKIANALNVPVYELFIEPAGVKNKVARQEIDALLSTTSEKDCEKVLKTVNVIFG